MSGYETCIRIPYWRKLTAFYEKPQVIVSNSLTHLEDAVLYTGCLRCRPMESSCLSLSRDICQIKHKVPNLAIEDISGSILQPIGAIWITVN